MAALVHALHPKGVYPMRAPKRPLFFLQEITKFTDVPKQPFVFYSKMQNFENCTQTVICIFHKEIRNLTTYHQFSFVS